MKVERLVIGQLATNCYLVWDENKKEAIIIDPGDDADYILRRINDLKLVPKCIMATHGHFDHVLAVTELKLTLDIPFLIHKKDLFLLNKVIESARYFLGINVDPIMEPEKFLINGDIIEFGKEKLKVIETPGHTPGGICLYSKYLQSDGVLFTGDTLFAEGVGRIDFTYSSKKELKNSLIKILKLPKKTIIYPGHGPGTSLDKIRL